MSTTVIFAGGGTGGHIYPALAVARALKHSHPHIDVHFVGARGGLEERIIGGSEFPLHLISIGKLHPSARLFERIRTVLLLPVAFLQALWVFLKLRPQATIGIGGYASGPVLFLSALFGRRSLLWELNAAPGLANRWLAPWVSECLIVFASTQRLLRGKKFSSVGVPVRSSIFPRERPPLDGRKLRLLVFGGSQGARAINNALIDLWNRDRGFCEAFEWVHQTGPADHAKISSLYQDIGARSVQCLSYINNMDERLAWADLVICRAGASTLAELAAAHKACILIPLPSAADDHQRKNAEQLSRTGAAMLVHQKDLSDGALAKTLESLLKNPMTVFDFESKIAAFDQPRAADQIVERLFLESSC